MSNPVTDPSGNPVYREFIPGIGVVTARGPGVDVRQAIASDLGVPTTLDFVCGIDCPIAPRLSPHVTVKRVVLSFGDGSRLELRFTRCTLLDAAQARDDAWCVDPTNPQHLVRRNLAEVIGWELQE